MAKWFYEGILGINATTAGFKQITIKPQFNHRLNQASGSYRTPQGEIKVSWTITPSDNQRQLDMQVTIPKNSRASFELPQVESLTINGVTAPRNKALKQPFLSNKLPGVYQINGTLSTKQ